MLPGPLRGQPECKRATPAGTPSSSSEYPRALPACHAAPLSQPRAPRERCRTARARREAALLMTACRAAEKALCMSAAGGPAPGAGHAGGRATRGGRERRVRRGQPRGAGRRRGRREAWPRRGEQPRGAGGWGGAILTCAVKTVGAAVGRHRCRVGSRSPRAGGGGLCRGRVGDAKGRRGGGVRADNVQLSAPSRLTRLPASPAARPTHPPPPPPAPRRTRASLVWGAHLLPSSRGVTRLLCPHHAGFPLPIRVGGD
jgi:hypothetical protein